MKQILTIWFGLLCCLHAGATHIVGGIMSVEHLAGNNYKVSLRVYRDCLNGEAPFDNPAIVGVFSKKTNELIATYSLPLVSQQILPFAAASCENSLPSGCTDMGVNEAEVTISPQVFDEKEGYYLSYQRCCRNGIIRNIREPGDAGIAIYTEIPSPRFFTSSSPRISENPNVLLCQDKLTTYNFGFKDPDGDVLKYSMTNPIRGNLTKNNPQDPDPTSGPYPLTSWQGGYSTANQILGNPSLTIHPNTGEINLSPSEVGTYVIAIKVEEFRAGQKIGEVTLELQFNVAPCFQPAPIVNISDSTGKELKNNIAFIQTPNSACYSIKVEDPTDSLFMEIENISEDTTIFPKPVYQQQIAALQNISTTICWEAACNLPSNTTQTLRISIRDNGCPKFARLSYTVKLISIPYPNHGPTDLLCMTLADNKQTTLYWGDSTPVTPYFKHYNLYRRVDGGPFVLIDSISNKATRSYTDLNTPDYSVHNYEYMMRCVNQCNNIGEPSDTLGTFEQLKFIPDQQQIISVSVAKNQFIEVTWPKTWEKDFAQYYVYKKQAPDPVYKLVYQTHHINDTLYRDKHVDVASTSYCYHIVMKDTCDNYGPIGYEACSILLNGETSPFESRISWTGYHGWCEGVSEYDIVNKGDRATQWDTRSVTGNDSAFIDNQLDPNSGLFSYYIVAHQQDPSATGYATKTGPVMFYNATSTSNTIELSQKPGIFVPNAFTPNNDQLNDTWNIRDIFIKDYKLMVYNKWGQNIFSTTDKNEQWTGKLSSGAEAPSDVYIYTLTYSGYDNTTLTLKGNVTILR